MLDLLVSVALIAVVGRCIGTYLVSIVSDESLLLYFLAGRIASLICEPREASVVDGIVRIAGGIGNIEVSYVALGTKEDN